MAQRLAIPPQISERNMPEGALGFKLNGWRSGGRDQMDLPIPVPKLDYWLAMVTPRRFCDQHPSEASGHSGRSLPYERTVMRLASTPSVDR